MRFFVPSMPHPAWLISALILLIIGLAVRHIRRDAANFLARYLRDGKDVGGAPGSPVGATTRVPFVLRSPDPADRMDRERAAIEEHRLNPQKCLFCEQPSSFQGPRRVKVESWRDSVIRWFGGTPRDHWRIETEFESHDPKLYCEAHRHARLALLQAEIARKEHERLEFDRRQAMEMAEFERFQLDELMLAEAQRTMGLLELAAHDTAPSKAPEARALMPKNPLRGSTRSGRKGRRQGTPEGADAPEIAIGDEPMSAEKP